MTLYIPIKYIALVVWLLLGFCGAWIGWRSDQKWVNWLYHTPIKGITPKNIILLCLASCLGMVAFVVGTIMACINYSIMDERRPKTGLSKWFNTPICSNKQ